MSATRAPRGNGAGDLFEAALHLEGEIRVERRSGLNCTFPLMMGHCMAVRIDEELAGCVNGAVAGFYLRPNGI